MEWRQLGESYLLRMDRGERVRETLTRFLQERAIAGGFLQGIGALEQVELGYYSLPERRYLQRTMPGVYELLALTGNIARVDGEPFVHAHALLSDAHFRTLGGHFFDGVVAVTLELVILAFPEPVGREEHAEFGLKLLSLR